MLRMLQHAVPAIGGDNGQFYLAGVSHFIVVRKCHRAGMEGGDLVSIAIGREKGLRRIGVLNCLYAAAGDIEIVQTFKVRRSVLAYGRHDQRIAVEELEVVSDVAGAPAELAADSRNEDSGGGGGRRGGGGGGGGPAAGGRGGREG